MNTYFCEHCLKETNCSYHESIKKETIDDIEIEYLEKYYTCNECGQKLYGDMFDYNILEANKKLREHTGLIRKSEIEEIINKYNIGKKPLSLVLGLGEITITRYLDGQNPTKENSELLKRILNDPYLYELFLIGNKDKITEIAFKKSLGKTKQLELSNEHSKLYNTALYIINKLEETTPLALQKLLYFAQCFSKSLTDEYIFYDCAEAWKFGPVYKEIYECFSYYKSGNIDYVELLKNREFNLSMKEKEYLDTIIKYFGCYSAKLLREMTHLTEPWLEARKGLVEEEASNRVIELADISKYATNILEKYNISNIECLKKYSEELFADALENL